jgi:hypothetical protein
VGRAGHHFDVEQRVERPQPLFDVAGGMDDAAPGRQLGLLFDRP